MVRRVVLVALLLLSGWSLHAAKPDLYNDPNQPLESRVSYLIGRLTLEEKVQIVTGGGIKGAEGSAGIKQLEMPDFMIAHGPFGFKGSYPDDHGTLEAGTYFPVSVDQASSWDTALVEKINAAIGEEIHAAGKLANAGPSMNIIRDPRGGRSFEYFTEDPYLNGQIETAYTKGLQSQKVMAAALREPNRQMLCR
jgi:beta-glucosidase